MKITVIGAGAMGGALVEGLLKLPGQTAADVTVADPVEATRERYAQMGATTMASNAQAVKGSDMVVVVVKPWLAEKVLREIKPALDYDFQTLILIAAGISGEQVKEWMERDGQQPVSFLAIPNIAIAQLASMTFVVPIKAQPVDTEEVKTLFDAMGQTIVTEERLLGAGTTLASCGIAYAMRYVRAASEGGVELGFKADAAKDIVLQTMKGAVALLQASGMHPEQAIDLVTTPGGVTIRGLNEMEHAGFTSSVIRGLKAGAK